MSDRPESMGLLEDGAAIPSPWLVEAAEVVDALDTDAAFGLSSAEAADRLARFGPNMLDPEPPIPWWRKPLAQFTDPLVLLLIAASIVSFTAWLLDGAVGAPFEVIVILLIVMGNAVLGYVQETRAEEAVTALARMAASESVVLRDGEPTHVPSTELVIGDVVVFEEGAAVTADGRLVESASLQVAEAALTGESEASVKDPFTLSGEVALGDRTNMVFNGTSVTRGRGRAVITATGMDSEVGRIAALLGETPDADTPLQREVARVGKVLGGAVIAIAVVVVAAIFATSDISTATDAVDVLLVGVSLAVAAVPEGLPAILSVVLALGTQRMARRNAIVKDLSSVETLGSASVICTDKTGTLTRNEMTIEKVVTPSGEVDVTGSGYQPGGEVLVDGAPLAGGPLAEEVALVIGAGALANDATITEVDGLRIAVGDPTEAAFLVAEDKIGIAAVRRARFGRVDEVPFTSERKLMTTIEVDRHRSDRLIAVSKGAPGVLLDRCTRERSAGTVTALTDERRRQILDDVDRLADQALRTLAVAYRPLPDCYTIPVDESVEQDLVFLGTVGIIDPPRAEARDAIAEAKDAGIRVIMITGDHPLTAARIAEALGISEATSPAITGAELAALDDTELAEVVAQHSVFARVAPGHKLRLVEALQADGAVVAMTGDGVNDAPALKTADIGVAMGITGTDVSKEAARVILADDNFATIIAAVREGRAIFSSIRKFLRYLLSSNVGEVLTMFGGVVLAGVIGLAEVGDTVAVPLLATQILWINLLTDAAPALALAFDPPGDAIMDRPPRRPTDRMIDTEMALGVAFVGSVMALVTLFALDLRLPGGLVEGNDDIAYARTMAFTVLVLGQLFNTVNSRSDRTSAFHHVFVNPLLWGAIALSTVLQVAVVHVGLLNDAFGTTPLRLGDWALATALASAVLWAAEARKLARRAWTRARDLPANE